MKKIGILFGQEDTFQWALCDRINSMKVEDIVAEPARIGHVTMGVPAGYAVILDRISHDIPYYKAMLKNEVLCGTQVINDPFWSIADDKFFENALAEKLGVAVPKSVLVPHHDHPPDTTSQSMRNMIYPLDWDAIFSYIGFPAYFKQHWGGGWKHVHKVHSPDEFFHIYAQTGSHLMMLQESIDFDCYCRCYCIGREEILVMPYEPRHEFLQRYEADPRPWADRELHDRVVRDALTLNRALGYDFNTAEFAVRDGVPVAIDFMNWAPDCERRWIGEENFAWVVDHAAKMLVDRVLHPRPQPGEQAWQQALRK